MARKLTLVELKNRFNIRHSNKYDYSLINEYFGSKHKYSIICPIHGIFYQIGSDHMSGCGCQSCDPTKILGNKKFINQSNQIHGNQYGYEKCIYGSNNYEKVKIICKIHGEFLQTPWAHMRGQGCSDCAGNKKKTTKQFIEQSKVIHGDLYSYVNSKYISKNIDIEIICKTHGPFYQKPRIHLSGHGCKTCRSSKMEKTLKEKLDRLEIQYEYDKRFAECRNINPLSFDFYLPDHNMCIECDGIQHFKSVEYFGGEERLKYQISNDKIKTDFCKKNNIKLIRLKSEKEIMDYKFSQ